MKKAQYIVIKKEMVKIEGKIKFMVDVISDEPTTNYKATKHVKYYEENHEGNYYKMNYEIFKREVESGWLTLV